MIAELAARLLYNAGTRAMSGDRHLSATRRLLASAACAPATAPVWLNLGNSLLAQGDVDLALGCFRKAMALEPRAHQPRINAGIALLTLGQWREGFALYESRFASAQFRDVNGLRGGDVRKQWDGSPLAGRTLLVLPEQGAGDTIMMARYGRALYKAGAGRVIWRMPGHLVRLMESSIGPDIQSVVSDGERVPEHDVFTPCMSLPHRLGETIETVEGAAYLRGPRETSDHHPLVGLVWSGSSGFKHDRFRSMSIEQLAPLFDVPRATFVNLQVGPRAALGDNFGLRRAPAIHDYYDTAGVLSALDLLITTDTSIAHLAGALGVPCWVMLHNTPYCLWMRSGDRTPWYDSIRLFRQRTPGDWAGVVARVREALLQLLPSIRP
jgi:hypothetical protein